MEHNKKKEPAQSLDDTNVYRNYANIWLALLTFKEPCQRLENIKELGVKVCIPAINPEKET